MRVALEANYRAAGASCEDARLWASMEVSVEACRIGRFVCTIPVRDQAWRVVAYRSFIRGLSCVE